MNFNEFFKEFLLRLSERLELSDTYLSIFSAVLGAAIGVFLTVFIGFISSYLNTLSYNRIARIQLSDLTENNLFRCLANQGVLNNELSKLKTTEGTLTLNGLTTLVDYPTLILHSPAKFRSNELLILRRQVLLLNSLHSSLVNVVSIRDALTIEIRKSPVGSQEWEVSGLRLEYDHHLTKKYKEIEERTKSLQDFLVLPRWQRFMLNILPTIVLKKMINKSAYETKAD